MLPLGVSDLVDLDLGVRDFDRCRDDTLEKNYCIIRRLTTFDNPESNDDPSFGVLGSSLLIIFFLEDFGKFRPRGVRNEQNSFISFLS